METNENDSSINTLNETYWNENFSLPSEQNGKEKHSMNNMYGRAEKTEKREKLFKSIERSRRKKNVEKQTEANAYE